MVKTKIGVLVSGGGSNLQAIINSCKLGILKDIAEVGVVISNKKEAYALKRAEQNDIDAVFVDRKKYKDAADFCEELIKQLEKHKIDLVCLAGFLLKLENNFIKAFEGRILNIHPALLPKFGGKGMYGHFVHEAVLKANETESGATVHWVDEEYDHGSIVIQRKVRVHTKDTPETLAKRVLEIEHQIYPEAIDMVIKILTQQSQ